MYKIYKKAILLITILVVLKMLTTRGSSFAATHLAAVEWTQVEIAQHYGRSMDVRPFIEYPHMEAAKTLLDSFLNATSIVYEEEGYSGLINTFLLRNIITTTFNLGLFTLMAAITLPLRAMNSLGPEPDVTSITLEWLQTQHEINKYSTTTTSIVNIKEEMLSSLEGVTTSQCIDKDCMNVVFYHRVTIPRYRSFTKILESYAKTLTKARLVGIGSHHSLDYSTCSSDIIAVLGKWPHNGSNVVAVNKSCEVLDSINKVLTNPVLGISHVNVYSLVSPPSNDICNIKFQIPITNVLNLLRLDLPISLHLLETI